ncbi:hypothetical protein AALP_AA8G143700 [Arabis alpina]|uniref:CCHC-type domain-containing protein n=1 Tax=Arabis alpina TaxID=50452 RepID=A0A087G712_ARAAL|nr:hypothetical protein AALP_AA8G143700 [Arabis alpina]
MIPQKRQPQDGMVGRQLDVDQQKSQRVLTKQQPKMVQQRQLPRDGIFRHHSKRVQPRKRSQGVSVKQQMKMVQRESLAEGVRARNQPHEVQHRRKPHGMLNNASSRSFQRRQVKLVQSLSGCYYCGKAGHMKNQCFKFLEKVKQLLMYKHEYKSLSRYYYCGKPWHMKDQCYRFLERIKHLLHYKPVHSDRRQKHKVWGAKSDLQCNVCPDRRHKHKVWAAKSDLHCNVAYTADVRRPKGKNGGPDQPHLEDVCSVEGLKANLTSISQLCDKGYDVVFTKTDCEVLDEKKDIQTKDESKDVKDHHDAEVCDQMFNTSDQESVSS